MSRRDEYDDERIVVVEQGGGNGIAMLLVGLAIGAGAALLFAPASGAETRERIQREARRAGKRVKDLTGEASEELAGRVGRTRARFDERVDRARDAVRSRTQAVSDAVDAGREAAAQARAELERAVADSKRAYADSRRAYREARRHESTEGDVPMADVPRGVASSEAGLTSADGTARDG
ncbi:MAG: YtxH domain-containing protein [Gemmatimonadaceae bacterium]|nr:YtxH domain-containing protein [Gemmatimonadaceae bacterium]